MLHRVNRSLALRGWLGALLGRSRIVLRLPGGDEQNARAD
ncbi:hypothetical protein FRUB_07705 [Fimbriiglobus ruber]|uniref:Uncharacterized protein n=1 Tax=Fimbriiglobus ruber TaxID=1908690 RepID=A0A225DQE7_9BACT|nr:hypothetical protein FRUB_07705 [Fimbriiglobus ruber]